MISLLLLVPDPLSAIKNAVHANSALLINADSGAVLYEKNAHKEQFPASLTKIATALYTLQLRDKKLDKVLIAENDAIVSVTEEEMVRSRYTLPAYWLTRGTAHIGIKKGEELSLRDLMYGMLVASGGDASNMIALYMGGTIPVFMQELNVFLKELGCTSTHFKNPHGLHHPHHVTTAHDLALLTKEALKNPTFREIVKTVRYERPETNKQKATTLIQTNRLLRKGKFYYSKALGIKTGYTSYAKNCLVAAASDGNRTLIAVFLQCSDRERMFLEAKRLFEEAFSEKMVSRTVFRAGPQKIAARIKGASHSLSTYLQDDVIFQFYPMEEPHLKCLLKWEELHLPIAKGQQVGVLAFEDEQGKSLRTVPLYANEGMDYHFFFRMYQWFSVRKILKFFGGCLAILFICGLLYELKKSTSG